MLTRQGTKLKTGECGYITDPVCRLVKCQQCERVIHLTNYLFSKHHDQLNSGEKERYSRALEFIFKAAKTRPCGFDGTDATICCPYTQDTLKKKLFSNCGRSAKHTRGKRS